MDFGGKIGDDHSRTIIHVDLDCFYAQVEMLKNPDLKDKSFGIQQKNIVVTSNYKARDYGIKKCMLITEAKKLCPNLILVNGEDLHDYKQMSQKVTSVLQKFTSNVERLGLDENYLDITNLVRDKNNEDINPIGHIFGDTSELCDCGCTIRIKLGSIIAQDIRNELFTELGLTSCAGIAHNKLLAKIVGSTNKPNQQTITFPDSAVELMLGLPSVSNITGIGQVLSQQLAKLNIKTVEDLQNSDLNVLIGTLGIEKGKMVRDLSFGIDNSPVKPTGKPQSIGIEDSCKTITEKEVLEKLTTLLQRLLILVEEDGRIPKTIKLTVRKYDKNTKFSNRETRQCNISTTLFDPKKLSILSESNEKKLLSVIMRLFSKVVDTRKSYHITLLGLSFTKFIEQINKNSLAMFLAKKSDLEVQSITNLKNTQDKPPSPKCIPSTSTVNSDSEAEHEPLSKKHKLGLLSKKRPQFSDSDDCESPSKLRVAELKLSGDSQNICCPPNADEQVFQELPKDVQKELWEDYKQSRDQERNLYSQATKKSKPNSILNYFVKQ
ncbi:unnamed protein product [Brassicogethes aeneus]|uniref:UmuC domain-containing protein n=1 Tax=Brassicogethes aeneus TaxID=1431903 RepID=A0A9P0FEF9_BRAAE|nr:unnamed protein product [Brassicogethes aeneus]